MGFTFTKKKNEFNFRFFQKNIQNNIISKTASFQCKNFKRTWDTSIYHSFRATDVSEVSDSKDLWFVCKPRQKNCFNLCQLAFKYAKIPWLHTGYKKMLLLRWGNEEVNMKNLTFSFRFFGPKSQIWTHRLQLKSLANLIAAFW